MRIGQKKFCCCGNLRCESCHPIALWGLYMQVFKKVWGYARVFLKVCGYAQVFLKVHGYLCKLSISLCCDHCYVTGYKWPATALTIYNTLYNYKRIESTIRTRGALEQGMKVTVKRDKINELSLLFPM